MIQIDYQNEKLKFVFDSVDKIFEIIVASKEKNLFTMSEYEQFN